MEDQKEELSQLGKDQLMEQVIRLREDIAILKNANIDEMVRHDKRVAELTVQLREAQKHHYEFHTPCNFVRS